MSVKYSKMYGEYIDMQELSVRVAKKTGFNTADVAEICDAMVAEIGKAVKEEGLTVFLPGLLKLTTRFVKEKDVRNPRTGEIMHNPEMLTVKALIPDSFKRPVMRNAGLLAKYKKEHNIE